MTKFDQSGSLIRARRELAVALTDGDPITCPCCGQTARIYRRKINATMARALITLWRASDLDREAWSYEHAPSLPGDTHEISQLAWWGLIEEERVAREDGGRAGFWRLTSLGARYVLDVEAVPKYAHVYDGRCIRLDGPPTSIRAALGSRFDLRELLAGA